MSKDKQQVELPFDQGGFTQSLEVLMAIYAQKRKDRQTSRPRRVSKPDLHGIDLDQPLLSNDIVWGIEHQWTPTAAPDKGKLSESLSSDFTEGCFAHLANEGRNAEFATPTFETIALLASKILYSDLQTLLNTRGNAEIKRDIIDWFFATSYRHDLVDHHKPMHKIPFTAQFCCMVEEIDYELLCEAINGLTDDLRERQEQAELVTLTNNNTEVPYGYQINTGPLWDPVVHGH